MVRSLRRFKESGYRTMRFVGDERSRRYRKKLAKLETKPDTTKSWKAHERLGVAELRLGHEREGLNLIRKAYDALPQVRVDVERKNYTRFLLGVAHMRMAETENCCQRNDPSSCILPIQGGGIHQRREHTYQAIQYFRETIDHASEPNPLRYEARWLLNIAYMAIDGYPQDVPAELLIPSSVFQSKFDFPPFKNISGRLGLDTFSQAGGLVVDDFDADGYLDVMTTAADPREPLRFFKNNGNGSFADWTEEAGLTGLYGGLNIIQGDYNNDGALDVFVFRGAWFGPTGRIPNSLLRNDGHARFTDVTFEAGLGEVHYPVQAGGFADFDNDGDLDLYVGNETSEDLDAPCQLFENQGDGTFRDIAKDAGVQNHRFTKAAIWGDYDGDRLPDLYVSCFGGANRLYRNNGDGTFTDEADSLDVALPIRSFASWFWDVNQDGHLDLFVTGYKFDEGLEDVVAFHLGEPAQFEPPRVYLGTGEGGFTEAHREFDLDRPLLPMGANFGDLNNDGYPDFYLGTGSAKYQYLVPNRLFLNQGGRKFCDVTMAAGMGHLQKGHAIAFADFDHDGDQDVFAQMGGFFPGDKFYDAVFENPGFGNHWIAIKLEGRHSNRSAIGARIRLSVSINGRSRSIYRHVNCGGTFGANPLRQTIGVGSASRVELLEVYWPTTDVTQTFKDVAVDQLIHIVEGSSEYTPLLKQVENRESSDHQLEDL